ncbi:glutamate-cysteine ligase family protein [Streptomyces nojiriensis]|uniref:carboxylate-amine ligase n=1 Tax=Streptomyces nojiriensis TaxID=66374 RepID=UPI00399C2E27
MSHPRLCGSRSQALALANRIRPWLPVLQAIGANSPYDRGKDSGHASWRSVEHARGPTVGPAPVLDEADYEHLASTLVRTGTILDRRMIYWYARPSEHVPMLEIRPAGRWRPGCMPALDGIRIHIQAATLSELDCHRLGSQVADQP